MGEYEEYLEQHRLKHTNPRNFPGDALRGYISEINEIIDEYGIESVLDYGCGKARYQPKQWDARNYDPAVPEFSEKPEGQFDLVVCTDVLEHIPEQGLIQVIDEIFGYANKWVFLSICCRTAGKVLSNGKNVHATVKPQDWWKDKLRGYSNYTVRFTK